MPEPAPERTPPDDTAEDRDRIGEARAADIRARCVCDRNVPAADFDPDPDCPIHGDPTRTLRDRVEESFGPAMRLGLQDAELFGEPGAERIEEWIAHIADWVLAALAGDPGDLPARMAEAIAAEFTPPRAQRGDDGEYRDATLAERADNGGLAVFFTAGDGQRSFRSPTAREVADAAMSVRWEDAARQAAEVERLRAELAQTEKRVRAKVAEEIEQNGGTGSGCLWNAATLAAAEISRGGR